MDNVLVVDDERNIRALVARVLGQDQVEVHGAATGKEGLQMADEVSPDLVLLDLRLPDMDGMDVLRALRSRYPEVAVIIITGFRSEEHSLNSSHLVISYAVFCLKKTHEA